MTGKLTLWPTSANFAWMSRNRAFNHLRLLIGSPAVCGATISNRLCSSCPSFFRHVSDPHQVVAAVHPGVRQPRCLTPAVPAGSSWGPTPLFEPAPDHSDCPLSATVTRYTSAAAPLSSYSVLHSSADAELRFPYPARFGTLDTGIYGCPAPHLWPRSLFPCLQFISPLRETIFLLTLSLMNDSRSRTNTF